MVQENHVQKQPLDVFVCNFIKKKLWHRCFPVNFMKFLRTPLFYRTPLVAASGLPGKPI